jgi:hypothetical protein
VDALLKHSLLLTHGTVYGRIDPLSRFDLSPKSTNIDQWDDPDYDWKVGLFERRAMAATQTGPMTDNSPIDFIHWTVTGAPDMSAMTQWQGCLKLLRHI